MVGRDGAGDNGAGGHHGIRAHQDAGHDEGSCANERAGSDLNGGRLKRASRVIEVVRTCAKVGFLGYDRAGPDLNEIEAVNVGAIANTCAFMKHQSPRHLNAGAGVHERASVDLSTERPQK
jgi:hypothetical protein